MSDVTENFDFRCPALTTESGVFFFFDIGDRRLDLRLLNNKKEGNLDYCEYTPLTLLSQQKLPLTAKYMHFFREKIT
jgi:hypothetical protein